jgi:hypothetical protein
MQTRAVEAVAVAGTTTQQYQIHTVAMAALA